MNKKQFLKYSNSELSKAQTVQSSHFQPRATEHLVISDQQLFLFFQWAHCRRVNDFRKSDFQEVPVVQQHSLKKAKSIVHKEEKH